MPSSQPMFNRRHYEKIAKVLALWDASDKLHCACGQDINLIISMIADMFESDNPRFDRDKFYKATRGE